MPPDEQQQQSNWGSNMSGVGSLLAGGAALLGMGDKESSGRNLGVKNDEFNQQSLYKYGITPYEALTAGASGNGANAIQGEANSARQFDAQMKMAAKELKLKADEMMTSRRNTDATNETMKVVADTNAKSNIATKIIDAMKIGNIFNPAMLMSDFLVPYVNSLYNDSFMDPNDGPNSGENFSAKDSEKTKKNQQIYWDEPLKGNPKEGIKEGTDEMWDVVNESFSFGK